VEMVDADEHAAVINTGRNTTAALEPKRASKSRKASVHLIMAARL
jgi:hypothetical protein